MILKSVYIKVSTIVFLISSVFSCGEEPILRPKPRAFPKVTFPEKNYQTFNEEYCQFTFEFPTYAEIQQDKAHLEKEDISDCWFDIYFPDFNCRLHCSYYEIGRVKTLDELKSDAFELMDWHNKKANYIDELKIERSESVQGFAFDIEGPAASPFQFYLTDNKKHFLRSSMYFNTEARPDSLAPITNFIKKDLIKMIDTFEWQSDNRLSNN